MISIQEFDKAYAKYWEAKVKPVTSNKFASPLEQFLQSNAHYKNKDQSTLGGYMFYIVVVREPPKEESDDGYRQLNISIERLIVSLNGQTSLPEFLNDYI